MANPKGTLVAIGGGEDKENDRRVLRRIVEEAKGGAKTVVVVAAASREPVETSRPYLRAFEDMGIPHVRPLDLQSRREVEERRTEERLEEADVVYFTGGDQVRLADVLRGSKALDVIRARYEDGAVIAGTSAGAAAMSATMLAGGEVEEGLGLLPHTIIDTHFIQRGRFSRLIEAVTQEPHLIGLGISEDTAFVVRDGHRLEVIGSDNVIVVEGHEIRHSNVDDEQAGGAMAVERVILHALSDGYTFDLTTRAFGAPQRTQKVNA